MYVSSLKFILGLKLEIIFLKPFSLFWSIVPHCGSGVR